MDLLQVKLFKSFDSKEKKLNELLGLNYFNKMFSCNVMGTIKQLVQFTSFRHATSDHDSGVSLIIELTKQLSPTSAPSSSVLRMDSTCFCVAESGVSLIIDLTKQLSTISIPPRRLSFVWILLASA